MFLDDKLNFGEHLKYITNKVNRSRRSVTIYKFFLRPHPYYGDIIFDQAYNKSFHDNLEPIQCNVLLARTGAIRDTSSENLYQKLGLACLQFAGFANCASSTKICKYQSLRYLQKLLPLQTSLHKHNFFKNPFFPSANIEWKYLDISKRNSKSLITVEKGILHMLYIVVSIIKELNSLPDYYQTTSCLKSLP